MSEIEELIAPEGKYFYDGNSIITNKILNPRTNVWIEITQKEKEALEKEWEEENAE